MVVHPNMGFHLELLFQLHSKGTLVHMYYEECIQVNTVQLNLSHLRPSLLKLGCFIS